MFKSSNDRKSWFVLLIKILFYFQGEMPRHMQLFVDRFLCDRVVPGNRVTVLGIYSIKKTGQVNIQQKIFKFDNTVGI